MPSLDLINSLHQIIKGTPIVQHAIKRSPRGTFWTSRTTLRDHLGAQITLFFFSDWHPFLSMLIFTWRYSLLPSCVATISDFILLNPQFGKHVWYWIIFIVKNWLSTHNSVCSDIETKKTWRLPQVKMEWSNKQN